MKVHRLLFACVAFTALAANPCFGLDALLLDDAYIDTSTSGTPTPASTNYGKAGILRVYGTTASARVMRTYLKFDVSNKVIPLNTDSSQLAQATLRLWINDAGGTLANFKIARLTSSWDEYTIKGNNAASVTWDSATEATIPITGYVEGKYIDVDVTAWVKGWMDGAYPNYGVMLSPVSSTTVDMRFDSKESLDTAHNAKLELLLYPARVPARGDIGMGSYTAGKLP